MLGSFCVLFVLLFTLSGCGVGYLTNVAYEQSKILFSREPIGEVIKEGAVSEEEAEKLVLVLDAREFAKTLGLDPGGSYEKFARIDRDVLSWIVMGSKKESFSLRMWWFPVVGSVPYKGFFEKADADAEALELEKIGLETRVRPTDAYSTLGWFSDPVLSTMLRRDKVQLVNMIIHESVHSTFWFPGHVPFNESLANFVADHGAYEFFKARYEENPKQENEVLLRQAERMLGFNLEMGTHLEKLHEELTKLYDSELSVESKLVQRREIFDRVMTTFKAKYPGMTVFKEVNNAEIMQLKIYHTGLDKFMKVYEYYDRDLKRFIKTLHQLSEDPEEKDPYEMLGDLK